MPSLSRSAAIAAPAERVFDYADDIRNLARHMSESRSMPMMGSKLTLEITTPHTTGVGATYRYSGRIMGLTIDFSETVTAYEPGRKKVWHTIGKPRLLIIDAYEMQVLVEFCTLERCALDDRHRLHFAHPANLASGRVAPGGRLQPLVP